MKKLFLAMLILVSATLVQAQVSGGIKAGVNLTNQKWKVSIMGQSGSESFTGTGFHVGGYLTYAVADVITIQPEVLYNGLKVDLEGEDVSLGYISVPAMFGYAFDNNRFVLQTGPQLGVLISTDPSELKDEDAFKGTDFSWNIGATVNINKFNISVRYSIGLSSITGDELDRQLDEAAGQDVDLEIKNNNLQFSVGYRLFGGE